ncbi:hypothetical protein C8J56DRAFT_1166152 [Mycena floridula]|nr:hypothetical protein C8J56DRAFT_1166152 [Mycena floridula]
MHPYGGPSICPRCSKSVYAAEQVIGPGRKLYHKPCLACTSCSKRLDSMTLLEHDQQPYCKSCHVKSFGTRDLRSANLPYSLPSSPPLLDDEKKDIFDTNLRTIPLSPTKGEFNLGRSAATGMMDRTPRPIMQTATGTRYGAALGAVGTPSPARKWGGTTPTCPKCMKSVYFAEQIKAVGQTWHKACLRCTECNTSLDSTRLRDHEGVPLCARCYNKLHGPQGSGYALLGKAGG